ncbi:HIV Tat-specific factor 1 homolog [Cimex lectularius]|uniref:RRM domain-containing protein n=1 Tax=Cimex lectularius TaxID=79782 RepID=A0A8I6RPG1_CIMLE|nr:HIV Tat-specific factor 1 homolog [Cimex lectularius]
MTEEDKNPLAKGENKTGQKLDETRLRYEGEKCFYTDPNTGAELEWKADKQAWVSKDGSKPSDNDYIYEDGTYCYTDKSTGVKYKWNTEENKWDLCESVKIRVDEEEEEEEDDDGETRIKKKTVVRQDMSKGIYGFEGDTHIYTDPNDGTVYLWDREKNAWFPKIDDDFLAHYQMSYGVTNPEKKDLNEGVQEVKSQLAGEDEIKKPLEEATDPNLKRKAQEPTWFEVDDENNTKVYVSNLPAEFTETEFVDLMQKCGLVMKDVDTGNMKVKLYTEPGTNILKGDALCTYIKVESVALALNLLDGYEFKGKKIKVERARFTMKGDAYDPSLKPKKRRRKEKDKIKKMQEKLFDWRPEKMRGERSKHERIVIVKNLFDPAIFDEDVGLILEYQQDLREECIKCGDVRKIVLYDKHPEGVAQINFKEAEAADACVQLLNGRWFGKRQIVAETWDGKTKYKIAETEAEINNRLKKWENFLEKEDKKQDKREENKVKDELAQETKDGDSDDTRSSAGSGDETE